MSEFMFPNGTTDVHRVKKVADKIRSTPLLEKETYNLEDLEGRINNEMFKTDEELAFLMEVALKELVWDMHQDGGTLDGFELNQGLIVAFVMYPSDPNTEY
jgi:hypothetical protein